MSNAGADVDDWGGGGLNPLNWPGRLAQYRHHDPEHPDARDVQDPHEWDDSDPGIVERLTPNTVAQWLATGMVSLVVGGLLLYLVPIFGTAFRNPLFLAVCLFTAYSVGLVMYGRKTGLEWFKKVDKSINYYGDEADVRLGSYVGTDGSSHLFSPLRSVSFAGLGKRFLLKRDLPYNASKLRSNSNDPGEEPVIDRLNETTVECQTETFGRVFISHGSGMDYDEFGMESDRYVKRPETVDEDVVGDMNDLIESLEASISTLRSQKSMLEERSSDLRDTREEVIVPELEQSIVLLERMTDLAQPQDGQQNNQQTGQPGDKELREMERAIEDRMQ